MKTYGEAENWLSKMEAVRLDADSIERPNTKWIFEGHFNVDVKVVLDRQPLMGTGPLPQLAAKPRTRSERTSNGSTGYL